MLVDRRTVTRLPACKSKGVGPKILTLPYEWTSTNGGPRAQVAWGRVVHNPSVSSTIASITKLRHLEGAIAVLVFHSSPLKRQTLKNRIGNMSDRAC